jgi:restriction system protein
MPSKRVHERPVADSLFVGRQRELNWLEEEVYSSGRWEREPIVISGAAGTGKTALVREFLAKQRLPAKWFDARELTRESISKGIRELSDSLFDDRMGEDMYVVLDGLGELKQPELRELMSAVWNYKRVRSLIITARHEIDRTSRRSLRLGELLYDDSRRLIERRLSGVVESAETLNKILDLAKGSPITIGLIADMARTMSDAQLAKILQGDIYDSTLTRSELVTVVKPAIVSANEAMVKALKKRPEDVFSLSPREYEKLVAELLNDLGYEVELTKATRDGGKDILAYLKTEAATVLTLVEAKRYRATRKIGVELVRTLYGTLCDYQANSAMMVTTSSYSPDAKTLAKKHPYQLSLKDYTDVIGWIQRYGQK